MLLLTAAALAADAQRFDLPTAIAAAWEHVAELRVAQLRVDEANVVDGFRLDDPQFRARVTELGSPLDPLQWTFRVRQDVRDLISAGPDLKARRADGLVEQAELELLREEVRLETVERFDKVRLLDADLALIVEERNLMVERATVIDMRLKAGLPVEGEAVDVAFDLASVRRREALAIHDLRVARGEFATWIGAPSAFELLGPDLRETVMTPLTTTSLDLDVRIADAKVEQAVLERRAAAAARIPFLDWVEGQVQTEQGKRTSWGVSAAVSVPVFSWMDRSVAAAKQGIALWQAERDRLAAERTAAIQRDQDQLESAKQGLLALDAATEQAAQALEKHQAKLTPDEVLNYRAALVDERRRALELVEEGLEARRRLEAPVIGSR